MKRIILVLAASTCLGCHAPVPSLNVLEPYGNARVPPPGTGSYGSPNLYYPNSTNGRSLGSNGTSQDDSSLDQAPSPASIAAAEDPQVDAPKWRPVRLQPTVIGDGAIGTGVIPSNGSVAQVAHQGLVVPSSSEQPLRIVESQVSSTNKPVDDRPEGARSLPAHDLTGTAPPQRFVPPSNAKALSASTTSSLPTTNDVSGLKWKSR